MPSQRLASLHCLPTCRCTAVTATMIGNRLLVANVGDSRAVLARGGKGDHPT